MDRLKAEESRLREQQQYGDWQKKEEHFHLKQATQRSKVRYCQDHMYRTAVLGSIAGGKQIVVQCHFYALQSQSSLGVLVY